MSETNHYNKVAIFLHWMIALLIIGQLIGGKFMENFASDALRSEMIGWHKSFGITVLILSLARLLWRFTYKAPILPTAMKAWEKLVSKLAHIALYVLMIGIPVSGWVMSSAVPWPIKYFYLIEWPKLPVSKTNETVELWSGRHELLAHMMIVLLLLHIGAALKHHFFDKDNVLTHMLPFLKVRQ